jgi:hypothetical protein
LREKARERERERERGFLVIQNRICWSLKRFRKNGEGIAEPGVVDGLERGFVCSGSWKDGACGSGAARNCGSCLGAEKEEDILVVIGKWR